MIKTNEFIEYIKSVEPSAVTKQENKVRIGGLVQSCYQRSVSLDLLFVLLIENFDKPGVRNFIINYLFDIEVRQLLFYIPQLCYLSLIFSSSFMAKFLTEGCQKSTEFFILVKSLGILDN